MRTDRASQLRQPCLAVTTATLASDGTDLAAVFATLVHIRQDTVDLDRMIDDAFPGAKLVVPEPGRSASFGLLMPDYPMRVFEAGELSAEHFAIWDWPERCWDIACLPLSP
jgi:predicted ATPase